MSFDMGFNFRGSSGYVTDAAYAVPVLGEGYPHTYTNGNGQSVNAGGGVSPLDRDSTNDPRIAGINYNPNSNGVRTFQVDLSSGSAPGAVTYTIDLAVGDASASHPQWFQVKDSSTVLIDGSGGGSGITTATDEYVDATLAKVTATTSWTGATVDKTFATTTVNLDHGNTGLSDVTSLAHFRLTEVTGASVAQTMAAINQPIETGGMVGQRWR